MKATIIAHEPAMKELPPEIHRFTFVIDDGRHAPLVETISLRTAKVLVGELSSDTAFISMMRAIVAQPPAQYDSLVGRSFEA